MDKPSTPTLNETEERQAAGRASPRAVVIHEIVRTEGESELERSVTSLWWSGFAAGLSMGFSFLGLALIRGQLGDAPWQKLLSSFGYSLGFLIVVLGRQQLFTESTLTAILPFLTRRDWTTFVAAMRLWGIVLAANLLGTFVFALLIAGPDIFQPETVRALEAISHEVMQGSFWSVVMKGVIAGWLIALMVWLLPAAGSARPFVIVALTYFVGLGGLTHVVAGSTEAAYAVIAGPSSFGDYLTIFLVPTLLGNTIGGVSLVALLNHAPVASELDAPPEGGSPS